MNRSFRDGGGVEEEIDLRGRQRHHRRKSKHPQVRDDAGETLIEILLALVILALASVALITAFETSINASAEHRSLANFDTVLASSISTTSSVIDGQYASVFSSCQPLSSYPSQAVLTSALNLPGYTAAIAPSGSQAAVEFSNNGSYSTSCSSGAGGDVGNPQLINVVVTDTATGISQNDTVVVDNPTVIQTTGVSGTAANSLFFSTQPEGATVNSPFAVQPILEVQYCTIPGQESTCSIVRSDLSPISSLTIASGPSGASLSNNCSSTETAGVATYSGCSLNVVGAGYTLFASEPDPSNPGLYLTATSAPFSVYAAQLITPTITSVIPSTVTAGAINVSYNGAPNAPANQVYSVKACTDSAMSANCVVQTNFVSGNDLGGLTAGSSYYVEVTAAASQNYLGSTSPPDGPAMATVKLSTPSTPTLADGTSPGSLLVTFSGSSNAPTSGQTYTVNACTNPSMGSGCVTPITNFVSGGTITVSVVPGSAGQPYYVDVVANASSGYLASAASGTANLAPLSSVKPPTAVTPSPSATTAGAITVAYTKPVGGVVPSSYTANVCTDPAATMCVSTANYVSGAQLTGLTQGTTYYVTITGVSSTSGYTSVTTSPQSVMATVQLTVPTITAVDYGSTSGSVTITGGSSNAPVGQTYTAKACTTMNFTGASCVTHTTYVAGSDFTGLAYTAGTAGATYYVQMSANPSTGYLGSTVSSTVPPPSHADTSQVGVPGTPTAVTGTVTGSITVAFTAPSGPAPLSYSVQACTNTGMTQGCVTQTTNTLNFLFTGLVSGTRYYVQVTDIGPVGYSNNISAVSTGFGVKAK